MAGNLRTVGEQKWWIAVIAAAVPIDASLPPRDHIFVPLMASAYREDEL
ncbi:hypothetical protein [Sphingomonas sp. Leaf17]|nr:hypothetical protein [Sphingomonas sp. Leaf17]